MASLQVQPSYMEVSKEGIEPLDMLRDDVGSYLN